MPTPYRAAARAGGRAEQTARARVAAVVVTGGDVDKGWPERWWTTALCALALAGLAFYDVWKVVENLAGPRVDGWDLLGRCLGGSLFALLAVATAHRAVVLRRGAGAFGAGTRAEG
ncbi:hypothetical protein [Streptomyces sp. C10-9-1]|uniref:hypothetical protein n=1 Tax=Streptomyces sp. C10-9-1 TaxID=1859285 RepID=UPI003D72BAD8